MRRSLAFSAAIGVAALGVGCARAGTPESTVRGTAALSTFQEGPSAVAARDETGRVVRAAVDAQGQFALSLAKGHTYGLTLEAGAKSVPIVFPRASGRLDATFVLKTNGALLNLGQVRRYPGAPAGGFHVLSAQVTCDGSESTSSPPGTDSAEQADATGEMAVGERNVPEEVGGCDDQEGDNVEQEGQN